MRLLPALVATLLIAGTVSAAEVKPEEQLKMRQGLMESVKFQFGPLGAFAQDKGPLPADAADRAANLVALAKIAPSAWIKGTEALKDAKTKPEAFTSPKFLDGFKTLGTAAGALSAAVASGDAAAVKTAAGGVGKACKGCHDDFRVKDD
jgi:cytochrome c556